MQLASTHGSFCAKLSGMPRQATFRCCASASVPAGGESSHNLVARSASYLAPHLQTVLANRIAVVRRSEEFEADVERLLVSKIAERPDLPSSGGAAADIEQWHEDAWQALGEAYEQHGGSDVPS